MRRTRSRREVANGLAAGGDRVGRLRATPLCPRRRQISSERRHSIAAHSLAGWSRKGVVGLRSLRRLTFKFIARLLGTTCQFPL